VAGHRTPRVVAARKLATRSGRRRSGRFLVEGAQAVREALDYGSVYELFTTEPAATRHGELLGRARRIGVPVTTITERAAELLSETVTPQGIVAVCDSVAVPADRAVTAGSALVAVLVDVADPGNAGTVLRTADAAGADAVLFAGDSVDPHNGKCVRASTGSLFHLPVARCGIATALTACRDANLSITATTGAAGRDLNEVADLTRPRAWLFGSEAHGLAADLVASAEECVRVPIYGHAESLNLGTAAAVCLYAAAMTTRSGCPAEDSRGPLPYNSGT